MTFEPVRDGGGAGHDGGAGVPSMDLAETDKQFEVKVDVPGWKPEELNIEMHGNSLVVKGSGRSRRKRTGRRFIGWSGVVGGFSGW